MSAVDSFSSNLSTLSYPRTGKRGVPQQFARRLYEMLQSEAKLALASPEKNALISWSESGFAFRILDVDGFTSSVLPKYFRTKKFSSFQRNLNLVSTLFATFVTIKYCSSYSIREVTMKRTCSNIIASTLFPFFMPLDTYYSMGLRKYEEVQTQTCTLINHSLGGSQSFF